jgi:hypothetical protein
MRLHLVTVTVLLAVFVQLLPSVPVTVYTVVLAGLAVTLVPVVADKPVEGLQVYEVAPVAVKVILSPSQIVGELTPTVGLPLTVI